jgi:hypothetical protein
MLNIIKWRLHLQELVYIMINKIKNKNKKPYNWTILQNQTPIQGAFG